VTAHQRQKAHRRAVLRAALRKFIDRPCKLSVEQTRALLNELCSRLGYCLPPANYEALEADPPTDPQAFTKLVMEIEGVGSDDPDMFEPVLELVLATFEGAVDAGERDTQ